MDKITFTVNGEKCAVGSEIDSDTTINDFVRTRLNLRGTKYMCKEGGCGCCIVSVTLPDTATGHKRTFSVNSCLVAIWSCQDWEITTVEGIGSRHAGYHPVQRTLAEYNGTQCGYCSPGWVMAMYGLLESNHYDLTEYEIENSFASNICRCTGYRPILDAFKSFAKDAPRPKKQLLQDIEDLKICDKKDQCKEDCHGKEWCLLHKEDAVPKEKKRIVFKDGRIFYRVYDIKDIFDIFEKEGTDSYMLVAGNTGRGAYHIFAFPKVLIDVQAILELKTFVIDQNLVIGTGTTLTDLMTIFKTLAQEREEFSYLQLLYEHLDLVAHIPVRNVGTIAGNLMTKHRVPDFSSDVFLLFEGIGATLTIVDKNSTIEVTPAMFLTLDMTGKVMTLVKIPPFGKNVLFTSFKIMPRYQNAHAQVNLAFLVEFSLHNDDSGSSYGSDGSLGSFGLVKRARLVIGGLASTFIHAERTEACLVGKDLRSNETLQEALRVLQSELYAEEIRGELSPEFRKALALRLFYKGMITLVPLSSLPPRVRSGRRKFRRTRPLSSGEQRYDTNPLIWPITEPSPKIEALIQCAGEAKYVNDLPTQSKEVYCAFVTAEIASGEIEHIDPTPALNLPGVLAFFSAKDIPGVNGYLSPKVAVYPIQVELFAQTRIQFYDQPIGVIAAETDILAQRGALLVKVTYKEDRTPPVLTIKQARSEPSRVTQLFDLPPRDRGADVQKVIKNEYNIFWQYHFTMETQSCVTRYNDDGIDMYPATQFEDMAHVSAADALGIEQNRLKLEISRCGGAYGAKIARASQISCACALVTQLLGRPARFVLSIQQNLRSIGRRGPSTCDFEVGVNDRGEIQYLEYQLYEDVGFVNSDNVPLLAIPGFKNCYDNRRWHQTLYSVTTNTPNNTYGPRAPGSLETIAMTEHIMEQISYELGLDPLEVRLANLSPEREDVRDIVRSLVQDSDYYKRKEEVAEFNRNNRWKKRGLRVAIMSWPVPITVDYATELAVYHGDGSVVVKHGGVEMGQGINTKVIQVTAYTLNVPMSKVRVKPMDSISNLNTYTSGSSRTTQAIIIGVIKCCQILLDRLAPARESLNEPTWEMVIATAYLSGISLLTNYRVTSNDVEPYRVGGACVSEIELDVLTGETELRRVDITSDAGASVNPELDVGQVEGAFVMGIGYWTSEYLLYSRHTGELLTDRTWTYYVPTAKDVPVDYRVRLRENSYNPLGPLGAKAVAEPPTCLAVSVAFAIRDAIAASREDSGIPRTKWFNVDGPFNLEVNVMKTDIRIDELTFN